MTREAENMLLLLVGLSGVMIAATGAYTRYVKPTMLPWLLAGSIVVVLLAVLAMVADIRRGGAPGHQHRSPMLWLLALPVVILLFISPPPIGARAVDTTAAATPVTARHPFAPLPPGPTPDVSVPDVLMRVAQDSAGTLDHRRISVTGFVIHAGDNVDLGRVVIICCAADAQLARLRLGGTAATEAARFPDDTWLRVEGEVQPGPVLDIDSVTQIQTPSNPYAY
ncbi:TIGR03943 family protein [Mycobacterium sp. MS1601]|uniref:TIGR03943 family putative permease subunit n=1 Tax=Mycobacterium sp. MS1601 TaxID=1936029 RepID=UPI0009793A5B|nr:TIGR03943 family protein [Mycobacterium sp. MS1601]AQA02620.1 TIGR03943 family protein [Mycobacterium sp. MS1601]